MADAESIEFVTNQHRGVGTAFLCVTKVGPIRLTDKMRITKWEPQRAMGVEHVGIVTGTGVFTLESIDARTTRHAGYAVSQRKRKLVEEPFGWAKTIAGIARFKFKGAARQGFAFTFAMAAYDLVRLPKLLAA